MERERETTIERAKQKTRVVVVVVVVVTLSLFSPSKSFGAVERGGDDDKRLELMFSLIESIAFRLSSPKALRRKLY